MNKEENLNLLKVFRSKGVALDVIVKTKFILNTIGDDVQPTLYLTPYYDIKCKFPDSVVIVMDHAIKIHNFNTDEELIFNDENAIKYIKTLYSDNV